MKVLSIFLAAGLICLAPGCASSPSKSTADATTPSGAPEGDSAPEAPPPGVESDTTVRLGPEQQPDREAEPLQFFYWRVDRMFDTQDANGDGMISAAEFSGEPTNFERIDANADLQITKQEVVDDWLPKLQTTEEVQ